MQSFPSGPVFGSKSRLAEAPRLDCAGKRVLINDRWLRWELSLACLALVMVVCLAINVRLSAQTVFVVDQFNPAGARGYSYADGQIASVWGNWFGGALQSLTWDGTSDVSNNPASGSMKVVASFGTDQYAIFDGFFVFSVNAAEYNTLTLDIRFDPASARRTNADSSVDFGSLRIGTETPTYGQDWFYYFSVPATNTNWVHLEIPLNPASDSNLSNITDVLIGFDHGNPSSNNALSGTQTFWVDNIQFEGPGPTVAGNAQVDWASRYQTIDGFGASSAWMSSMSTHDADLFFSTNNGIGLSLLRSRIAPDGTTSEASIMQMAAARGARVWSTPWSPPAEYKDTNSVDGGDFVSTPANFEGYAAQLARYLANMKNGYGLDVYALSIQNEPDVLTTNYESCLWSAQQLHDFLPYLAAAMTASNVASTKIVLPEDEHWQWQFAATAMGDPATSNLVGLLAAHDYGSSAAPVTNFGSPCPKTVWETEHYFGDDDTITNGVELAGEIHSFMTAANASAYHYWWLTAGGTGGLAGSNTYAPAKRLYTMGNFSLFVRPGFCRIDATNATSALVSAYKSPVSGHLAIVAVNPQSTAIEQGFSFANCVAGAVTPWITSSQYSLAALPALSVTNGSFSYVLPPLSVITFVGQGTGTLAASFHPLAPLTTPPGLAVSVTNELVDPNQPGLDWEYTLAQGPSNSALNATNGVFTWCPRLSQAGTTNTVVVTAGAILVPGLGATNRFSVAVSPIVPPGISCAVNADGGMQVIVNGPPGFSYTVQSSTNMVSGSPWANLYNTNSPALPFVYSVVVGQEPSRFYRVRISDLSP